MHVSEEKERVANYRPVYVTEISDSLHFYTQDVETGMQTVCICQIDTQFETEYMVRWNVTE